MDGKGWLRRVADRFGAPARSRASRRLGVSKRSLISTSRQRVTAEYAGPSHVRRDANAVAHAVSQILQRRLLFRERARREALEHLNEHNRHEATLDSLWEVVVPPAREGKVLSWMVSATSFELEISRLIPCCIWAGMLILKRPTDSHVQVHQLLGPQPNKGQRKRAKTVNT